MTLIDSIELLLLVSYSATSIPQQNTLFWLIKIVNHVEENALKEPLFEHCQAGFLKAGVYGSLIAEAFTRSHFDRPGAKTLEASKLANYQKDIDSTFYIDHKFTKNQPLTVEQHAKIRELIAHELTENARKKGQTFTPRSTGIPISTWHGFDYQGQACDITWQENPPIPVISHCCLLLRLRENEVQFLENGTHALSHIKSNRLNIIAPQAQHSDPMVMAHVLKKIFLYLKNGTKLTLQSQTILGDLLGNDELAMLTIRRFIFFYGRQNPEYYSQIFKETPLPVVLLGEKKSFTLAEFLIRKYLSASEHLNTPLVVSALLSINYMPLFTIQAHVTSQERALSDFMHYQIDLYLAKTRQSLIADLNPHEHACVR